MVEGKIKNLHFMLKHPEMNPDFLNWANDMGQDPDSCKNYCYLLRNTGMKCLMFAVVTNQTCRLRFR